jgi:hypothetical protein
LGKWSKALIYCEETERYLTRLTSVSVLGLSTHSLAIAYGLLGMHERAHALFTSLMHTEGKSSAFSIFRELNPFYNELYAKRSELAITGNERELEVSLNTMQQLDEIDYAKQREREKEREKEMEGQSRQQSVSEGSFDRTEHVHMQDSTSEVSHNITAASHTVAIEDRAFDESVDSSLGIIRSLHIEVNEKKHVRSPSFSSVVEAIIKKIRANKLIAKVMKEKRAVKRNSVTTSASEEVDGLGDNGVCEGAPSAASIPKTPEAQGTISFQLSLMTGRGMDSVKAELCMLNALIAMNGGEVSSNLNTTSKVLTIEEHCEDGLRCIANIFEDSNHNQISYYANTCDQVHSYIVEARLYTILATLSPASPASPARPSSSSTQNVDVRRSNESNDLQSATAHMSSSSSSPKMKYDRKYYIQKAKAAMEKCEALGRTLDAPGVLFTTGFQMAVMGIDVERGKAILSESIDIIEYEADKIVLEKEKEIEKEEREKEIEEVEERDKEYDNVTEGEKLEKTLLDEKQSKEENQFMYNRKESYDCVLEKEDNEYEEEEEEEGEVTIGIRNVFAILTETGTGTGTVKKTAQNSKNQPPKTVTEIPNYSKKETKPSNKKIDDFKYLKKSASFEMSLIPIVSDARRLLEDYKK